MAIGPKTRGHNQEEGGFKEESGEVERVQVGACRETEECRRTNKMLCMGRAE